ncbi:MAG: 50S ribosomal protein L7/L12, partial [Ignavibacteria bacterium]
MSVVDELVERIEKLTLLEASELKKALEDKFGVTAAATVVTSGTTGPAASTAPAEEKTEFTVM